MPNEPTSIRSGQPRNPADEPVIGNMMAIWGCQAGEAHELARRWRRMWRMRGWRRTHVEKMEIHGGCPASLDKLVRCRLAAVDAVRGLTVGRGGSGMSPNSNNLSQATQRRSTTGQRLQTIPIPRAALLRPRPLSCHEARHHSRCCHPFQRFRAIRDTRFEGHERHLVQFTIRPGLAGHQVRIQHLTISHDAIANTIQIPYLLQVCP